MGNFTPEDDEGKVLILILVIFFTALTIMGTADMVTKNMYECPDKQEQEND